MQRYEINGSLGLKYSVQLAILLSTANSSIPGVAQCLAESPGGSSQNVNRPADSDTPVARFSPISYANERLPRWLCFTAGYRARVEGVTAKNFQPGNSETYLLTRFRLGVAIKPTRDLGLYVELQDATAFWKDEPLVPPYQGTWDLRRAYVDLGDIARSSVALRVGRQDISFGHARLLGTSYWRNVSQGYDAAMMVVNWNWLRLNAFSAAPVIAGKNGLSHHQQGNVLHGVYSHLKDRIPGSSLEPYLLWRLSPGFRTEIGAPAKLDEKIFGFRWAGTASDVDYDAEAVAESGHVNTDRIRAWAWSAIVGYTFRSGRWKPRLFVKYDFASGDRNPKDGTHGTFDQLYPNIHDHHGLADQIAWQNLKSVRVGIKASLLRNWTLAACYNDWWLASATDGFYNASGSIVARDVRGTAGTHIGREFDVQTSYRFNRQVELGAGLGHVLSGDLLVNTNHAHSYTYPYVMLNYNFF